MTFDAFLFQSFGGPNVESDIIPFLENVTRGRNIPRERLDVVANQYRIFGGKSPINEINSAIIERLATAFLSHGIELPIYFGNRNFEPYVYDALAQMKEDGRKRAIAFVTSAFGSFSGCKQYKLDVEMARSQIGPDAPEVVKVRHYYSHPGFIEPLIENSVTALESLPEPHSAELVFTAHSIPRFMADTSPYLQQLNRAVNLVAAGIQEKTGRPHRFSLVFQSRTGPPNQQWLEPDVSDHLKTLSSKGVRNVVVIPISFISDHMEVIYDLDTLAAKTAREVNIAYARAGTSSNSPQFIDMIVDLTRELLDPTHNAKSLGGFTDVNGCSAVCCPSQPNR
ncbi:MAG: ferrochelatase [Actinomycetota bacterium]|nr:ferrochelatase [Actinomycetota bacterium]